MKSQTSDISKIATTKVDDSFDFLKDKNLFAKKHARAKEMLKKMNLPKDI